MKSSPIGRSSLSKESMDVIENLASEDDNSVFEEIVNNVEDDNTPEEYVREKEAKTNNYGFNAKAQEIDMLWQNFRTAQFSSKSPLISALGGFIAGILATLMFLGLGGVFKTDKIANNDSVSLTSGIEAEEQIENNLTDASSEPVDDAVALIQTTETNNNEEDNNKKSQDVQTNKNLKKYVIKDGDTVEAIIIKNYGSYTPERAEAIMKANHLKNLDHISIDQVLYLPLE